jgi:hypothetical protein
VIARYRDLVLLVLTMQTALFTAGVCVYFAVGKEFVWAVPVPSHWILFLYGDGAAKCCVAVDYFCGCRRFVLYSGGD